MYASFFEFRINLWVITAELSDTSAVQAVVI